MAIKIEASARLKVTATPSFMGKALLAADKPWYATADVEIAYDRKPHGRDRFGSITLYVACKSEKEANDLVEAADDASVTLTGQQNKMISDFSAKAFKTFAKLARDFVQLSNMKATPKKPGGAKTFEVDKAFIKAAK